MRRIFLASFLDGGKEESIKGGRKGGKGGYAKIEEFCGLHVAVWLTLHRDFLIIVF